MAGLHGLDRRRLLADRGPRRFVGLGMTEMDAEKLRALYEAAKWQEPADQSARAFGAACARHDQARAEKALFLELNTPAIRKLGETL